MENLNHVSVLPLESFYERLMQYLPSLLFAILIFLIGLLLGLILKYLLSWLLRAVKIDKFAGRTGAADLFKRGGLKYPLSDILAKGLSGIVVLIFAAMSLVALNIPTADRLFERLLLFLPNLFAAGLIIFLGYILGNFLARAVLIAAVNAGLKIASIVAVLVKVAIIALSATMALEQIGIGGETIVIAFGVLFGGIVLALSLALGIGGKDIAKRYLEKRLEGSRDEDEIKHI
jgi:hypothetical protein